LVTRAVNIPKLQNAAHPRQVVAMGHRSYPMEGSGCGVPMLVALLWPWLVGLRRGRRGGRWDLGDKKKNGKWSNTRGREVRERAFSPGGRYCTFLVRLPCTSPGLRVPGNASCQGENRTDTYDGASCHVVTSPPTSPHTEAHRSSMEHLAIISGGLPGSFLAVQVATFAVLVFV